MYNIKVIAVIGLIVAYPGLVHAQDTSVLVDIVSFIETILSALFPIMAAMGILMFGYNIGKYLTSKDIIDQNIYKSGILNSLLALFIMFTVFGLIKVVASSLGIPALNSLQLADDSGKALGSAGGVSTFRYYALTISKFLSQRIIPIMIGVALLFFMGNIVISMSKSNVESERTKMNDYLKWGVFALFLLLSLFGIIGIITGSFFGTGAIIPQFQTTE